MKTYKVTDIIDCFNIFIDDEVEANDEIEEVEKCWTEKQS